MTTAVHHISDLLFEQECVIIPGFGALLSRYYPAEINPATHMMRPPSRRIAFNARICDNDGMLASFISKKDEIGYSDALAGIEVLVRGWKRMLQSGKKVNLPGIGRFYMDSNQKLQFSPSIEINYHKESFGLGIFRAHALQREITIAKGIEKAIDDHRKVKGQPPIATKAKGSGYWRWAAVVTPFLALGLAAGIYFQNSQPYPFIDYAGFFPFENKSVIVEEKKSADTEMEQPVVSAPSESVITPAEIPATDEHTEEIKEKLPVKQLDNSFTATAKYHIIVGSFKEVLNAENYVSELKSRGYDAYVAKGDSQYSRVAIGNFSTHDSASAALSGIKNDLNPGSWIYSN